MSLDFWRHYLRGRFYQMLRRPDTAVAEYRLALHVRPDSARTTHGLAVLLASLKRHIEAEHYLRDTLRLQPLNAAAWFNLGFLCDETQRPREAIAAFEQAVHLNAKLDRAWYGMGLCFAALGEHAQAAHALEQAATLQSMNPYAWYHLGMAHHMLQNRDRVTEIVKHLHRFDPKMTRRLILDTERNDLAHLVADLKV